MTKEPFVIERTIPVTIEKVWKAITDKDQMKHWYFDLPSFKPEVGFTFQFEAGKDEKKYLHICTITEVAAEKKLSYSWRYEGYEGSSEVTFELFAGGESTRLRLTHKGLETFPATNPDLTRENFEAGWDYIIGTGLAKFLAQT